MRPEPLEDTSTEITRNLTEIMKTNNLTRFALLIALSTSSASYAQDATANKPKLNEPELTQPAKLVAPEAGTLTATINDSVTFSTLKAALVASGLDVTLGDKKGVYTIFAPTDEAFDKLPAGTLGKLLLPQNKEKLRSLLLFHVIPGKLLAADLKDGEVTTMNAEKVKVDVDGDKIEVGDSKVFSADVAATNGVMHSVGEVLVPKSLEGFSGLKD